MKFFQRISTILPRRVSTTVNNQFLHVSCRASSSAVARPASVRFQIQKKKWGTVDFNFEILIH